MQELRIDPEFRDKIPPLTETEFEQLRENILADGEVYEPIVVWNGTIIDGHNRWKIIQENYDKLKDKYRIKEINFPDKWAAFDWMYKKQLGRRNLTNEQKTYMIGKMYEARKNTCRFKGNQHTADSGSAQNGHKQRTSEKIAAEIGVGKETVKRAEKFSNGIDVLRGESAEAAEKVLNGNSTASKENIIDFPDLPDKEKKEMVSAILDDTPTPLSKESCRRKNKHESKQGELNQDQIKSPHNDYKGLGTRQYREERKQIAAIVADMYDPTTAPEYTVADMVDEIKINAKQYIGIVRNVLADRSTILTDENRLIVASALTDVIEQLIKIRKLVKGNESVSEGP